jgi:broad specificity phosphatase PhoE
MLAQKGPILRLLFARHGHPDYRTDTLTALGHQEAAQLAEALDPYPLDAIYVSTHGRAQETAEYTLRRRSQNPILCDWLREIDGRYGYEGNAPEWIVGDPRPSAYELHPSDLFGSSQLYSYEEWRDQVEYGPWLYPRFSALQAAFDEILAQAGYVREGLRYRVRASDERTLAFFCHDGVMRGSCRTCCTFRFRQPSRSFATTPPVTRCCAPSKTTAMPCLPWCSSTMPFTSRTGTAISTHHRSGPSQP